MYRRDSILLSAAVGIVGVTFGVLAETSGLTMAQAIAMSAFVFTGTSQFAAVIVIASGGTEIAAVISGLVLALRNAFYGPSVASLFRPSLAAKLSSAHFVIDETTAMATAQTSPENARRAFWTTAAWLYALWNLGTAVGVIAGRVIANPDAWGLDAAFPAAFVALIIPHLQTTQGRLAALGGAVISIGIFPFTSPGIPVLASVAGVAVGAIWIKVHQ
jgi:4-azaleucine resistance transporter AzlC